MAQSITTAGIDIAKEKLDLAITGLDRAWTFDNTEVGWKMLAAVLVENPVDRVGVEASGGYEQGVVRYLRRRCVKVLVLQPAQVKAFARVLLRRAKNDQLDAATIAACTAVVEPGAIEPDDRLAKLASNLTFVEQVEDDIVRIKNRLEHTHDKRLRQILLDDIVRLKARKKCEIKAIVGELRQHQDLDRRLELAMSVPGIGLRTAVTLIVRMPELGFITREQAAALAGLAPFDDDSGKRNGKRHIAGGREQVRSALYAAALPAAFRWNPQLVALYQRLTGVAKKDHKPALIACARKLLIFVNTVLTRQQPWTKNNAQT